MQKTSYEMRISDLRSDVVASDLSAVERTEEDAQKLLSLECRRQSDAVAGFGGGVGGQRAFGHMGRAPSIDDMTVVPRRRESMTCGLRTGRKETECVFGETASVRRTRRPLPSAFRRQRCWHRPTRCAQLGRASCRERVCQYVYISVVAGSLKKKTERIN